MECGMIHNENYITIQGWMINELKLKGNELLVYACIYGFSQTENQVFSGSRRYLANWANCTLQGVSKCLKSLYEKGYIDRKENSKNGVKFIDYWALPVSPVDNKVYSPRQQSLQGVGNFVDGGRQLSCPHNIEDNIDTYNSKKIGYNAQATNGQNPYVGW